MTGRLQILRSNVAGNRPTGRQPGELYVNWPDSQLGVINSTSGAQDLIAVTFYTTGANYVVGQFVIQGGQLYRCVVANGPGAFNPSQWAQIGGSVGVGDAAPSNPQPGTLWWDSVGGQLYVWYVDANSSQWVVANNAAAVLASGYLALSGGTMTGPITLSGNPAAPLQTVPKQYVDALPVAMNDNRIINGDMRIDQRNNGAIGTAAGVYTVDRWAYGSSQAAKGSWQRNPNAGTLPAFPYGLLFTSLSAFTPVASDYFQFYQSIEADMISDFAWGTSSAQPVTLSFWAYSSLTGTFAGAINNAAGGRSYAFSFNLPTASTWAKIVIVIPGDTGGTWVSSGNAAAATLSFDLGSGANYRGAGGAWVSAGLVGVTGAVRVVSTNNAQFLVTGVKLETGNVATPFNRQSLAKSMADCQRYYQAYDGLQISAYVGGAGPNTTQCIMWPTMRTTPTAVVTNHDFGNANQTFFGAINASVAQTYLNAIGAGVAFSTFAVTLDAEI